MRRAPLAPKELSPGLLKFAELAMCGPFHKSEHDEKIFSIGRPSGLQRRRNVVVFWGNCWVLVTIFGRSVLGFVSDDLSICFASKYL